MAHGFHIVQPRSTKYLLVPRDRAYPSPKLLSEICCRKPMACLQLLWRRQAAMRAVKSAPRVNCGTPMRSQDGPTLEVYTLNMVANVLTCFDKQKTKMVSNRNTQEQSMRVCEVVS